MPRVVPSDVVRAMDRMFGEMTSRPGDFPGLLGEHLPSLAGLVALIESIPAELLVLPPDEYTTLTVNLAYLRAVTVQFGGQPGTPGLRLYGFDQNPMALIRGLLALCPDEAPPPSTLALAFIADVQLRESIRLDISAANSGLAQGEWKSTTVLAGSAIEALLLWALQQHEAQHARARAAAITALRGNNTLTRQPDATLERWDLHEFGEVAGRLAIITPDTAALVRLARNFRNLIHPGRALRLGQKCDHATALGALAAMHAVARDVAP